MTYAEMCKRENFMSDVSDLTTGERALYDAFLELGETPLDKRILSIAWLRHHAESKAPNW